MRKMFLIYLLNFMLILVYSETKKPNHICTQEVRTCLPTLMSHFKKPL